MNFGHDNIIGFSNRPFDSVEEMDEKMIAIWNETVNPDDQVIYLGDFLMGRFEHTVNYIKRLNGRITLIPGNHDKCWQGREKKYRDWEQVYIQAGVETILQTGATYEFPTLQIGDEEVWLSHFPFSGDSHEMKKGDKFSAYRPDDVGQWLLHGHVHNNGGNNPRRGRQLNVGVDVWNFVPVHIDWIQQMIEES